MKHRRPLYQKKKTKKKRKRDIQPKNSKRDQRTKDHKAQDVTFCMRYGINMETPHEGASHPTTNLFKNKHSNHSQYCTLTNEEIERKMEAITF